MLAKANYRQSGADFAGNTSIPSLALLFVTGSLSHGIGGLMLRRVYRGE